jgi:hypothetical protein
METPDLSAVTRIQTPGGWIDIKRGSLAGASGVMYRVGPDIHALYRYKTAPGVSGAVRAADVIAFEPFETLGMEPRVESTGETFRGQPVRGIRDVTSAGINRP